MDNQRAEVLNIVTESCWACILDGVIADSGVCQYLLLRFHSLLFVRKVNVHCPSFSSLQPLLLFPVLLSRPDHFCQI